MDTETILLIVLISLWSLEKTFNTIIAARQPSSKGGEKIILEEVLEGILGVAFYIYQAITGKPIHNSEMNVESVGTIKPEVPE
jgi:hypothetical protein